MGTFECMHGRACMHAHTTSTPSPTFFYYSLFPSSSNARAQGKLKDAPPPLAPSVFPFEHAIPAPTFNHELAGWSSRYPSQLALEAYHQLTGAKSAKAASTAWHKRQRTLLWRELIRSSSACFFLLDCLELKPLARSQQHTYSAQR